MKYILFIGLAFWVQRSGLKILMTLCRLCHWYFDEGLLGVGKKYEVLVSSRVQVEQNLPGHVLTLKDRPIFTPSDSIYQPIQENFDWHRRKAFRA